LPDCCACAIRLHAKTPSATPPINVRRSIPDLIAERKRKQYYGREKAVIDSSRMSSVRARRYTGTRLTRARLHYGAGSHCVRLAFTDNESVTLSVPLAFTSRR